MQIQIHHEIQYNKSRYREVTPKNSWTTVSDTAQLDLKREITLLTDITIFEIIES